PRRVVRKSEEFTARQLLVAAGLLVTWPVNASSPRSRERQSCHPAGGIRGIGGTANRGPLDTIPRIDGWRSSHLRLGPAIERSGMEHETVDAGHNGAAP